LLHSHSSGSMPPPTLTRRVVCRDVKDAAAIVHTVVVIVRTAASRTANLLLPPRSASRSGGRVLQCRIAEAGGACARRGAEAVMPVVTIARVLGSRGDEIGRALAERLNYRYLDHR